MPANVETKAAIGDRPGDPSDVFGIALENQNTLPSFREFIGSREPRGAGAHNNRFDGALAHHPVSTGFTWVTALCILYPLHFRLYNGPNSYPRALEMTKGNATMGVLIRMGVVCSVPLAFALLSLLMNSVREAQPSREPEAARLSGGRFVFADFDGDEKPDLALVEMQSRGTAPGNYSIRLQFSRGRESAIGVSAPFGGLRVAARDVNGDDNLDLVLTSNLDATFVAVLLNDGHGNFSAAPAEIVAKERASESALREPSGPELSRTTLVCLPSSLEHGIAATRARDKDLRATAGRRSAVEAALLQPTLFEFGRSPPAFFL